MEKEEEKDPQLGKNMYGSRNTVPWMAFPSKLLLKRE